ncbi:hypothetical protein Bca4012_032086 [Brassica carinata]
MIGDDNTQTGTGATPPVADLTTMMQTLEHLNQQDTYNKATNERLDVLVTAYAPPAADDQEPETARRRLFPMNINPTGQRATTTQQIDVLQKPILDLS